LGFFQKPRDRRGDLRSHLGIVSMARAGAHLAKPPPRRPVVPQQALSVSGPDQIGKRHPVDFVWRSRGFLEITFEHLVGQLIGELEALDQPIADLLVSRLALVTLEALAKPPYGVAQRCDVKAHRALLSRIDSDNRYPDRVRQRIPARFSGGYGAEYISLNLPTYTALHSAAIARRSPRCCSQRSTRSFVSFSWTPFCERRRRRVRKIDA